MEWKVKTRRDKWKRLINCESVMQILELLILNTSPNVALALVKSNNKDQDTALQLHQKKSNRSDKKISDLLQKLEAAAEANAGSASMELEHGTQSSRTNITELIQDNISAMIKSSLLGVFIFIAAAAFESLFNLGNIYLPKERLASARLTVSLTDAVLSPHLLPIYFYFMVFNTVTFMGSMIVILVKTWPVVSSSWPLCLRIVLLFVMGAMVISYCLVVKITVPVFLLMIGSCKISSFWAVWLYDLHLAFSVFVLWFVVKQILQIIYKLIDFANGIDT